MNTTLSAGRAAAVMPLGGHLLASTAISAGASTAVNGLMAFVVFHGQAVVPSWGPHGFVVDAAPAAFMTVLMSTLLPAAGARKLLRQGRLAGLSGRRRLAPGVLGGLCAIAAAIVACGLAAGYAAAFSVDHISFAALLATKVLIGVLAPAVVTPLAVKAALTAG